MYRISNMRPPQRGCDKGVVIHGLRTTALDPANLAISINHLTWTLGALL